MLRVKLVYGRDKHELYRKISEYLDLCNQRHYTARRIIFPNTASKENPTAFIEFEVMDRTMSTYGEE